MKKILVAFELTALLANATTLPELFDAVKNHSQTKADEMVVKNAEVSHALATSKLYPTINLFGKYDNYSGPTGMLPVPPNVLKPMLGQPAIPQPFSRNIYRGGANFSMPIFVKSIYTMADKAKIMQHSALAKKRINLLKNEALIVGSNANFLYLNELNKSLDLKAKSLRETKKMVTIKVNNGRAAGSALYKIDDALNQVSIAQNNIALQKEQIQNSIRSLTGITLTQPVEMHETKPLETSDEIASLQPLKLKIEANRLDEKAQKEKLYPTVAAYGSYVYSRAKAYNNNKRVNEEYGNVGVVVNIPLLAMDRYKEIKKSKMQMMSQEADFAKLNDELTSKAKMLKDSLPLLDNSIKLAKKSIVNREQLLKIAKINYESGRLSTEEYLRYEDEVVSAKARYYQAKAKRWQSVMELAVIYANNIEEMVK